MRVVPLLQLALEQREGEFRFLFRSPIVSAAGC